MGPSAHAGPPKRMLAVVEGNTTALVVRAQPTDSAVTLSEAALSDDIFGTASGQVSMSSQEYTACSHGKLNFVKEQDRTGSGYSISNGAGKVPLPTITNTAATSYTTMRGALTASLKLYFGVINPGV
jgi:hypothetical protein